MKNPLEEYQRLERAALDVYQGFNRRFNLISVLRLLLGLVVGFLIYLFFQGYNQLYLLLAFAGVVLFLFLTRYHNKIGFSRRLNETLEEINQKEIAFLSEGEMPFEDGREYVDSNHSYTFDLDIFGAGSLFQLVNRTATHIGKKVLAGRLGSALSPEKIVSNQEAIRELAIKVEWRQKIFAFAMMSEDNPKFYQALLAWSERPSPSFPGWLKVASYLFPLLFVISAVAAYFNGSQLLLNIVQFLFVFNLFFLVLKLKSIKEEVVEGGKVYEVVKNYSKMLEQLELAKFDSPGLQALQSKLAGEKNTASAALSSLSKLFSELDNLSNPLGAILINGIMQQHLHTYRKLGEWKTENAGKIKIWLEVLGEFEALNSLANFSFNNPEYAFPSINQDQQISFHQVGHPLIGKTTRVNNDISFAEQPFVILTGSNMSGKSTFLRSLGINMVLASIGSVVCAKEANVHPLPVFVSMRSTDSLNDGESYFFAEVKRLKKIMTQAEGERTFILLDEILRGTNSDDKRDGTVAVIKRLINKGVVGLIATHDLKVCDTTAEYPKLLVNKCFEVEIVDNELAFDYTLRKGICQNKNAVFIMEKMGVV